jgi:small subunit ribosomal protein S8
MVNDPVGDFIIQLKNAGMVRKIEVSIPYSKLKHAIADKLVQAGFITSATKYGKKVKKTLDIALKYDAQGAHVIPV